LDHRAAPFDVWMSLPPVIPLANNHGRGRHRLGPVIIAIVAGGLDRFCRVLRSEVLIVTGGYVPAALSSDFTHGRTVVREVLPEPWTC